MKKVSEIINTSTGTIRVIDSSVNSAPIRVNTGGVVNKIENDGTISATGSKHSRGIISINSGIINQLINTGIFLLKAVILIMALPFGITVELLNKFRINFGHRKQFVGIRVGNDGNISSITNSGTISGGTYGIANSNNITNIINTGTITGSAGYGIDNTQVALQLQIHKTISLYWEPANNYYIKLEHI